MSYRIPLLTLVVAVSALTLACGEAWADVGERVVRIEADDGDANDEFGVGISLLGDFALIGAPGDEDGSGAGSAYLFDVSNNPFLVAKLMPDDGAPGDRFGYRTALADGYAFVQANFHGPGTIYVFDISDPTQPMQVNKIVPDDGVVGDQFGWAIRVSDGILFVGAHFDDAPEANSGSVYLFDISDPEHEVQLSKVVADDGAAGDVFGSVRVSGDLMIVGAWGDDDNGESSGSGYVFDVSNPRDPVQLAKIVPEDLAAGDRFGVTCDIDGHLAVFGAIWSDDNGEDSGSSYLFDLTDPVNPVQRAKIIPTDNAAGDNFGRPAIRGNLLVCGARFDDGVGSAYFFDVTTPTAPEQEDKIYGDDTDGWFGNEIVMDGAVALIKAQFAGNTAGAAYLVGDTCPEDVSSDGYVAVDDLLVILGAWGGPGGDVTCDGTTGIDDMLAILGAWGPCPGCDGESDCNGNGICDALDVQDGTVPDCNGNHVPDSCDIDAGTSLDCNGNGVPDECDVDCNGNEVPDDCDIDAGTSLDWNGNGVPDECEPPPSNDECAAAQPLPPGVTSFTTVAATTDGPAEPSCFAGDGQVYYDVWFNTFASCDGEMTVSVCDAGFDTRLAVYIFDPDCPPPADTTVACDDDGCGLQSSVTFDAVTGTVYRIRVGGAAADQGGDGSLSIVLVCDE